MTSGNGFRCRIAGNAEAEFAHASAPGEDRTGFPQAFNHRRVLEGDEAFQRHGAGFRGPPPDGDVRLKGHLHPG